MNGYDNALKILENLFGKDYTFILATIYNNSPSQRVVDTYYCDGAFWVVTYALSNKVKEIMQNPNVSICNTFHVFKGMAYCEGHPLDEKNREIRKKLIKAFEAWYFAHNNEEDKNMCYIKIVPTEGFFHKDGTGYKTNFITKTTEEFSFAPQIDMIK